MSLKQNSPEWLAKRKNYIGASDAAVIMGVSPWKTQYQLWQEKLDLIPPSEMTEQMKRGHDLEAEALSYFCKHHGFNIEMAPEVVFSDEYYFMMASLDGLSKDGLLACEIKCPGYQDHETARLGKVPDKYYPQLQHQICVTGLECIYYVSYTTMDCVILPVYRDQKYIDDLIAKEKVFWEEHVLKLVPPELTDKDYVKRQDDAFGMAVENFLQRKIASDQAESKLEHARKYLLSLCEGKSTKGCGVKVTKSLRKGAVDYASIDELKDIDLDKYRKSPSETWRITEINES